MLELQHDLDHFVASQRRWPARLQRLRTLQKTAQGKTFFFDFKKKKQAKT
jgi:hypothetical protein